MVFYPDAWRWFSMTGPITSNSDRSVERMTYEEDDIESELFFSTREAGVACFLIPGPEVEEGAA
jgi:hypothetical protein